MQDSAGFSFPETASARARKLLAQLLAAAGPGDHLLTYAAATATGAPFTAHAHAKVLRFGPLGAVLADRVGVGELRFALALALEGSYVYRAGLVMRSGKGPSPTVRAWRIEAGWIHPLSRDEVMRVYAIDPDTGGTMPLDPFVTYADGIPLPRPAADHHTP